MGDFLGEFVKMVVVLTVICAVAAGSLAMVRQSTAERIELQQIKFIKEPAVKAVITGFDNDPILDRKVITVGGAEGSAGMMFFPGQANGQLTGLAYEVSAKGYHGDIGVMVGVDVESGALNGIRVVSHTETPGLGARVVEEGFQAQFKGIGLDSTIDVSQNGGVIDGISGASLSSKGVCKAVRTGLELFNTHRDEILAAFQG